jgi:SAM-dependent MidA family methyltransferase
VNGHSGDNTEPIAGNQSPLHRRLAAIIAREGAIPLADYVHICLADHKDGYYRTRQVFGSEGDFITAPEVSQIFGELIGIWCLATWHKLGRPIPFCLAEPGPGRGTLMSDALRAGSMDADFAAAVQPYLLETSPQLVAIQRKALIKYQATWITDIADLPAMATIIVANEFLDALPFRQYVKRGKAWHEIAVGLNDNGDLQYMTSPSLLAAQYLPEGHEQEPEGSVFEHAPAREAMVDMISAHLKANTGAALLIDYGHPRSGFGDTFQAVMNHRKVNPLEYPGKADLTSHVDFARLDATIAQNGMQAQMTTQANFLLEMGLLQRAGQLGAGKSATEQEKISFAVERLAAPGQMGNLFKIIGFSNPSLELDGFPRHPAR